MFGIFQSSRMASGRVSRHFESACWPSSASTISKSSPSRIRRATLRMTLESSTIKQVRMLFPRCRSCGRCRDRFDVEQAVNVHDHQQPIIEPMNSGRDARKPRIEVQRLGLPLRAAELQHLADRTDDETEGLD